MKTLRTLTILLAVFALMACVGTVVNPDNVNPDMPPEIAYGEDLCDQCGQVIDSERFAASVVLETEPNNYEYRNFDDINGMLMYTIEEGDLEVARYYVHDYRTAEWLDARDAYFVKSGGLLSPTTFGLVACAQRFEAEALARTWDGEVLTFSELRSVLFNSVVQSYMDADLSVAPY